jgi:hypothetical protein
MKFDLWDVETNKYLGHFDDESEALVLVRTLVSNFGPAYADDLEMGGITDEGESLESLSGAALIARADEVLSRHVNHGGQGGAVIGSKVAPRRVTTEESMVAAAPGGRKRVSEARNRKRQKP